MHLIIFPCKFRIFCHDFVFAKILIITDWVSMKIKKRYVCGIVLIVMFIGLGIFALVGLEGIINNTVLKSVWLDP